MRPLPRRPSEVVLIAAVAATWSCDERREHPPLPPEGDGTGNVVAPGQAKGEPNGTSVNPTTATPPAPSTPNGSELTDTSASVDPRTGSTTESVTGDATSAGSVTPNTRTNETPVSSSVDETLYDAGALEDAGATRDTPSEQSR
jgi:hypothetical protein